jgi:protein-disulfide isomerase
MTSDHAITGEELMAFFDGELSGERLSVVGQHVGSCLECQTGGEQMRELSSLLRVWRVSPAPATLTAPVPQGMATPGSSLARPVLLSLLGAVAIVSVLTYLWNRPAAEPSQHGIAPALQQSPIGSPQVRSDGTVTVSLFVDWICPSCARNWQAYMAVLKRYEALPGSKVRFVVKDWPWDRKCNAHVSIPGHEAACVAAVAVRLARTAGQADQMIEWLFANQTALQQPGADELIRQRARDTLRITDFGARYAEELPSILRDIDEGNAKRVRATPFWFVNDVALTRLEGPLPTPEELERAIQTELKRVRR